MNNIQNNPTNVKYSRETSEWHAINGRIWRYPPGPAGKRQAQMYALEHDTPLIADEVKRIIALAQAENPNSAEAERTTQKAIKAGFLVREGHVLPPRTFSAAGSYLDEIARVRSQTERWPDGRTVEYAITQHGDVLRCECQSCQDDGICKHTIAFSITETIGLDAAQMQMQQTTRRSEALEEAILQAELAYNDLSSILHAMRVTRDDLNTESVDALNEILHSHTTARGLSFVFEIDFNMIYSELEAKQPKEFAI